MEGLTENVFEWITGDKTATVTLSQKKYISKVKKLAEKFPDDVQIMFENSDGSIVAHLPLSSIKLNIIKREYTDEQRQEMGERLRAIKNQNSDEEFDEEEYDED